MTKSEAKRRAEHEAKYRKLNARFHLIWYEDSPRLVGQTLESLIRNAKEDPHLNNIPLVRWDRLAKAFLAYTDARLSLAEAVCMQKQAARDLVERCSNASPINNDKEDLRDRQK